MSQFSPAKNVVYAGVAQLVEQRIRNAQVTCSSHATSSIKKRLSLR